MSSNRISRRGFLQGAVLAGAGLAFPRQILLPGLAQTRDTTVSLEPLEPFGYGDVALHSELHEKQLQNTHAVLMGLSEGSLLKPFRQMGGQDAPGEDLGGWYTYKPDYDYRKDSAGLCPGGSFGQWVSALSRMYAITGDAATRDKVLRLNRLYAQTISSGFYEKTRFPAYSYDKLVCGLIDAHQFAGDPKAFEILKQTTDAALPHLPDKAVDREQSWRPGKDLSYNWDESYTLPENLFLAYRRGAGVRYRQLAIRYLDDATYFDPLAAGKNVLPGKHAYSYVNALSSAMQAYLTLSNEKYLRAAKNAFAMLTAQSFATGGWGPDELLRAPGSGALDDSLSESHNSFETPCGAYAHFKLTRYLLMVTQDSRYGDSMEQVMYNTVLGARPLQPDGSAFYYSDYNFDGHKTYAKYRWPCCSGTLPQVAADYRFNTYFRDSQGIYVNLYIPSTVRFARSNAQIELTQTGTYPFSGVVQFQVKTSRPAGFRISLRIPAWAEAASISVNGKREAPHATPGAFAAIYREWKTGDSIVLELSCKNRLEAIDAQHPDTVALLHGPLVLFAITETPPPVTKKQLLAAKLEGEKWQVETADGALTMLPFTAIADEPYSTYLRVS
jgi:uncharacterized protein